MKTSAVVVSPDLKGIAPADELQNLEVFADLKEFYLNKCENLTVDSLGWFGGSVGVNTQSLYKLKLL